MLDDEHGLEYSRSVDKGSFEHMALSIKLWYLDDFMSLTISSTRGAEHWGLEGTFMYIFSKSKNKKQICFEEASYWVNSYWPSSKRETNYIRIRE